MGEGGVRAIGDGGACCVVLPAHISSDTLRSAASFSPLLIPPFLPLLDALLALSCKLLLDKRHPQDVYGRGKQSRFDERGAKGVLAAVAEKRG